MTAFTATVAGLGELQDSQERRIEGWRKGYEPHPLFSGAWYLAMNPDVAEADVAPLLHYATSGASEMRTQAQWDRPGLVEFFSAAGFRLSPRLVLERPTEYVNF